MISPARYTVAAAVLLSASAASAAEDVISANRLLPACKAFIANGGDYPPIGAGEAGRCVGLMRGLWYARLPFGSCPPAEVTWGQMVRVAITYIEARPERMHEDFGVLAVEAMQKAWPCKK